ncbi:MAG: AAA family ATPase [Gemmataceae bacterium]|nr:AAA family ATPase [Gemmataceae bacterium]
MIQLLGSQEGREAEAARDLHEIILASWPWVEKDDRAAVSLVAGVKCHGQKRRDVDIVLLATFGEPVRFTPFLDISWGSGPPFRPKEALLESLCVTIEVKEQDASGVRFTGAGRADVRYCRSGRETWSSATDQSEEQKYSLKNYLEHNGLSAPHISNLIWLKNVLNRQLPARPHNLLGSNSTWELFFNVLFQLDRTRTPANEWMVSARRAATPRSFQAVVELLTLTLQPTSLDRVRMDRITQAALREKWVETPGERQLVLRGRGGSGKTMLLLQLAWRLYETLGRRVLLLTYNRALAADLRRMLTLMSVPDDVGDRHILIQTVYAFFFAVLKGLELVSGPEQDFLQRYDELKAEALALLRSGALTADDVARLRAAHPQAFDWDYVFIDEGQDWPKDERDLLRFLWPPERFVIADGVDQLVRGAQCDWQAGVPSGKSRTDFLPICLRMKAGLAQFCNVVAETLGLVSWKVGLHPEAPGGRVVIVEGEYFAERSLHDSLLAAAAAAGNEPVDLLGCVPPNLVVRDAENRPMHSIPAERLSAWGWKVWDGVLGDTRTGYPIAPSELRVVQYESSRGLEGWSVFLWGLDDFYDYKFNEGHVGAVATGPDAQRQAALFAARWLMIPLTRAIDSLIIQISTRPSRLRTALQLAARTCQDFVEWRCTES